MRAEQVYYCRQGSLQFFTRSFKLAFFQVSEIIRALFSFALCHFLFENCSRRVVFPFKFVDSCCFPAAIYYAFSTTRAENGVINKGLPVLYCLAKFFQWYFEGRKNFVSKSFSSETTFSCSIEAIQGSIKTSKYN